MRGGAGAEAYQLFELVHVQLSGLDAHDVSGVAGHQRLGAGGADGPAHLGDEGPYARLPGGGRVLPEAANDVLDRHDLVGVEQQHTAQRTLTAREPDGAAVNLDFQRPQQAKATVLNGHLQTITDTSDSGATGFLTCPRRYGARDAPGKSATRIHRGHSSMLTRDHS